MYLKLICPDELEAAVDICSCVQGYLPKLIQDREIIKSGAFKGAFDRLSIIPMIEKVTKVDWNKDIVLVVICGALYFADIELTEVVGCTLEGLPIKADGTAKPFTEMPRLGALWLPNNMSRMPRGDGRYWAKLGVEELLHYFRVPERHDERCFFHSKGFGEAAVEDCWKDYCPKCRQFMGEITDPLDFRKLFETMQKIYGLKSVPTWKRFFMRLSGEKKANLV